MCVYVYKYIYIYTCCEVMRPQYVHVFVVAWHLAPGLGMRGRLGNRGRMCLSQEDLGAVDSR